MKRLLFATTLFATTAAIACAVSFSPGDYSTVSADGSAADRAAPSSDAPINTTPDGSSARVTSLLVIAGDRDSDNQASDVWRASISETGEIGAFETLPPALFRGPVIAGSVVGGRVHIARRSPVSSMRMAESVTFPPSLEQEWTGYVVPPPMTSGYGTGFAGATLLTVGGGETDGGAGRFDEVWLASPDGGGLIPSATRLAVPMRDMAVVSYKDFVYVIGGESAFAGKVHVARIDAANGVGTFLATTDVTTDGGVAYTASSPIYCAAEGHMFAIGGARSEVVLTAAIDEATGNLGPWTTTTKLKGELRAAGCAVFNGKLHLFGGQVATGRTDVIQRATVSADGKVGEWEIVGAKLPNARSSIFAFAY